MAKPYSLAEETVNVFTHGVGFLLSIAALVAMLVHTLKLGSTVHFISFSIFGASLVTLYGTSTIYHNCKDPILRSKLRILDHASIYVLIAGTYTPFTLITLQGKTGWLIFGISWGMAITGIILKLFFTGKYTILSTFLYIAMGWIIVFAFKPLKDGLPAAGLLWLVIGGLAYTIGALLYNIGKIPFNHAIFHLLVMVGSACHFIAVYLYVV